MIPIYKTTGKIIGLIWLLCFLSACAGSRANSPTQSPVVPETEDFGDFGFQARYFRGSTLGFVKEVKPKVREAEINIVDMIFAIQHALARHNLLQDDAPYVLAVTVDELKINPLYNTAFYSFRAEDDYIEARVQALDSDNEVLHTYNVSASADRKEAITGDHQQRLQQFYKRFAESIASTISQSR